MSRKITLRLFTVLLVILLSTLPLFMGAYVSVFNQGFYRGAFARYDVYEKYEDVDMDKYNKEVFEYLRGEKEGMPSEIYLNEDELEHMEDVKDVFSLFILVFWIVFLSVVLLFISLFYLDKKRILARVSKIFIRSGSISLAIGIILFLLFYFGFTISFNGFHELFFEQGSWLFSASDNIINIYPAGLFFDISMRVFSLKVIFAVLFLSFGLLVRKKFIKRLDKVSVKE